LKEHKWKVNCTILFVSEEIGLCVLSVTSNKTLAAVVNEGYRLIFLFSLGLFY